MFLLQIILPFAQEWYVPVVKYTLQLKTSSCFKQGQPSVGSKHLIVCGSKLGWVIVGVISGSEPEQQTRNINNKRYINACTSYKKSF